MSLLIVMMIFIVVDPYPDPDCYCCGYLINWCWLLMIDRCKSWSACWLLLLLLLIPLRSWFSTISAWLTSTKLPKLTGWGSRLIIFPDLLHSSSGYLIPKRLNNSWMKARMRGIFIDKGMRPLPPPQIWPKLWIPEGGLWSMRNQTIINMPQSIKLQAKIFC